MYRFYGWQSQISDSNGLRPCDYYDLLKDIWCEYSCAPRMRKDWNKENCTLGQCSITAFLMQDIYGGKVCGIRLPDGNYHCFNVVNDEAFDLTSEQFSRQLNYDIAEEQFRELHFAKTEKKERYEYLKTELHKALSDEHS